MAPTYFCAYYGDPKRYKPLHCAIGLMAVLAEGVLSPTPDLHDQHLVYQAQSRCMKINSRTGVPLDVQILQRYLSSASQFTCDRSSAGHPTPGGGPKIGPYNCHMTKKYAPNQSWKLGNQTLLLSKLTYKTKPPIAGRL